MFEKSNGETFSVSKIEEAYWIDGDMFFETDIVMKDGATCYPTKRSEVKFCFSK